MTAAIIPNLDSIAEFRILSDNFDAEFGNIPEARSTSSQNRELTSTTAMSSNSCETPISTPAIFLSHSRDYQNQFGGTGGGPIVKKSLFLLRLSRHPADSGGGHRADICADDAGADGRLVRSSGLADRHRKSGYEPVRGDCV